MKEKKQKEIRLNNVENLQIRSDEQEENKMVIEGYPIVFEKETLIECFFGNWYEKIDRNAFANADMSDVCLKYNHNDDFFIMARTRNNSLQLSIDDHGVFMHAELINTTQNRDVYEMVKSELLKEGSFAFTVEEWTENVDANNDLHRTINKIGKLFDVAICPNGAYGDMTEIYARSYDLLENNHKKLESLKRCKLLKLRNKNKIKLMEAKK